MKAASDFAETESKANTTFRGMEADLQRIKKASLDTWGLSKQSALDYLATAGAVAQGLGFTREESLGLAESVVTLTADFASFHNLPHEQVHRAIIAGITGEREGLKALGIVINQADVDKQALLETGKKQAAQLTQEEKAAATLTLIYERGGPAIGDYARTKDSVANRSRAVKERMEELSITFGERLLPLFERALTVIEPVLERFGELDEGTQNLIVSAGMFAVALGPVATAIGVLIPAVQGLAAALMWLYANPIGLLIAALALLAVGLVKAYQESETFRNTVDILADVLQVTLGATLSGLITIFKGVMDAVLLTAESFLTLGAAAVGWTTPDRDSAA